MRLAGIENIESWRPLQAEVVQPRRLLDGLLEVRLLGSTNDDLFLLELATYPEQRIAAQMAEDQMLIWLDRQVIAESIVVVLHPKGRTVAANHLTMSSRHSTAAFTSQWTVVKLWELKAADLLRTDDVGIVPWIPLTKHRRDPERILQECRDRIDSLASADERVNLLTVTQILARLRYNDPRLFDILGGSRVMIESPLLREHDAKVMQQTIVSMLRGRYSTVTDDVIERLEGIVNPDQLQKLAEIAGSTSSLNAFETELKAFEIDS